MTGVGTILTGDSSGQCPARTIGRPGGAAWEDVGTKKTTARTARHFVAGPFLRDATAWAMRAATVAPVAINEVAADTIGRRCALAKSISDSNRLGPVVSIQRQCRKRALRPQPLSLHAAKTLIAHEMRSSR